MYLVKEAISHILDFCKECSKASEFKTVLGIETNYKLNFKDYITA